MGKLKYTKEKLEEAVKEADSISDVVRYFGREKSGSVHNHISKKIKKFNVDISHFTRSVNQTVASKYSKLSCKAILVYDRLKGRREKSKFLRRALIEMGHTYECEKCKNKGEWQGEKLVLEIDHINEDRLDNKVQNLRFLCPNCHSLRGNNIPKNKSKICKNCKNPFKSSNKVFCSKECYRESDGFLNTDKSPKNKKSIKKCIHCGKEYEGSGKKYCSVKCSNRDKNYESNKPSKEQLSLDMKNIKSFRGIGKKYEVSDNAVRKWFKKYNLSINKKDY